MAATAIEALQEFLSGRVGTYGGYEPVVVKTEYAPGKFTYGVQYWTHDMIATKVQTNPDRSTSELQFTVVQAIEGVQLPEQAQV